MPLIVVGLKTIAALTCLVGAAFLRAPQFAELRPWSLWLLLGAAAIIALVSRGWRRSRLELVPCAVGIAALLFTVSVEMRFQVARRAVLKADPAKLEQISQHIIVGFNRWDAVRGMVERRAVGGVFVTKRNVAGMDAAAIAREIASLQAIRKTQGLQPLWIATDQEGGSVARMSPPLPRQTTLAKVIRDLSGAARQAVVRDYAVTQGRGLADLGINLNFAPVIDLDHGVRNPADAYTRIGTRAISADPAVVAEVAGTYCDGLAAAGVLCTLKHFPGLGRVFEDTHQSEGVLTLSRAELEVSDWVPFRRLLGNGSGAAVMVGHVRLPALDSAQPVSTSAVAINGLLRDAWSYQGLVVTDDLCMGAIYAGRDGIAKASVRALNAGVDLLLISWDGEQLYPVLAELLTAVERSKPYWKLGHSGYPDTSISGATLARSAGRLEAARRPVRVP
jgi:beta-N-acetylhexosaminidase